MEQQSIGLIIIDSVAALYRIQSNIINRSFEMRKLVSGLLRLSHKYKCGIVCVNQVTSVFQKVNKTVPSLGLAWSNLVRSRLKISKIPKQLNYEGQSLTVRRMEIIFSPESPCDFSDFLITSKGVCDIHIDCLL